jgi:NAD(P)H-hydrate repair Nnr-like enzyme with NAD(P)H-hydrate dehydratase domain
MMGHGAPTDLLAEVVDLIGGACPLIVDAAGLDAFVELDETTRTTLRDQVVMTPNRQETSRLAGEEDGGNDDLMAVAARRTGAVMTSFGLVLTPDGRSWQTSARPTGLGTSGTGDVLAGLVGGGVARCADIVQGTCWATFAHMEAGVRLDTTVGIGYLARELLGQIPALLAAI